MNVCVGVCLRACVGHIIDSSPDSPNVPDSEVQMSVSECVCVCVCVSMYIGLFSEYECICVCVFVT